MSVRSINRSILVNRSRTPTYTQRSTDGTCTVPYSGSDRIQIYLNFSYDWYRTVSSHWFQNWFQKPIATINNSWTIIGHGVHFRPIVFVLCAVCKIVFVLYGTVEPAGYCTSTVQYCLLPAFRQPLTDPHLLPVISGGGRTGRTRSYSYCTRSD